MYELCFLSNLSSAEWAAWVQAFGTIAAIFGSVGIAIWASARQARRTRERDAAIRAEQANDAARAIYEELANRLARCVFDFENPWSRWIDEKDCRPGEVSELRLRKFRPVPPVIYPAAAAQMSLLKEDAPQAVIHFFSRLAIFHQDMRDVADHCQRKGIDVPPNLVAFLAGRLERTLSPGLEALEKLSAIVAAHEKIDAAAIREVDRLFDHKRSHLTLRERIIYYVKR